ncbi:hypothetical protein B0H15DRAFT_934886 [Mycena belliarum]|uniref:Uncharacterized protein n=1 Tax=Mycena belliarum TaxID=1033014 RepID=A0AAD6TNH3_9AGAR|nr:hypothetical protein B0H15DRAFT_934886 [Mycena belliae]
MLRDPKKSEKSRKSATCDIFWRGHYIPGSFSPREVEESRRPDPSALRQPPIGVDALIAKSQKWSKAAEGEGLSAFGTAITRVLVVGRFRASRSAPLYAFRVPLRALRRPHRLPPLVTACDIRHHYFWLRGRRLPPQMATLGRRHCSCMVPTRAFRLYPGAYSLLVNATSSLFYAAHFCQRLPLSTIAFTALHAALCWHLLPKFSAPPTAFRLPFALLRFHFLMRRRPEFKWVINNIKNIELVARTVRGIRGVEGVEGVEGVGGVEGLQSRLSTSLKLIIEDRGAIKRPSGHSMDQQVNSLLSPSKASNLSWCREFPDVDAVYSPGQAVFEISVMLCIQIPGILRFIFLIRAEGPTQSRLNMHLACASEASLLVLISVPLCLIGAGLRSGDFESTMESQPKA